MSSSEGKAPPIADNSSRSNISSSASVEPIADISSRSNISSSTPVDTSIADTSSRSNNSSSASVDPIADISSRSHNTSSTPVDTSIADTSSQSYNTSSTPVDTSIADISSRSHSTSSTPVDTTMTEGNPPDSDEGGQTPRPKVVHPDIIDQSLYPGDPQEVESPPFEQQAWTQSFHGKLKIENDDAEEGEVMESIEHDQDRMDWSNAGDEWHHLQELPAPPSTSVKLYTARRAARLAITTLVKNADTQVQNAMESSTAVHAPSPSPLAMKHLTALKSIAPMKNRPDVFIQYRAPGQTTTLHAGSIGKPKIPDHSLRLVIDAGKRGRPSLTIVLMISPDPAVPLETDVSKGKPRNMQLSLRFPTGNYGGKHSIIKFSKAPATADIQGMAQATIQPGGPTVKTWTVKFTTDFCFAEGFDDIGSLASNYSAALFEIINAMQAIRSGADVELSFMLKSNEAVFEDHILVPFEHAVNTELPQFFPYRHLVSKKPIIDLNMENVMRIGEGMFRDSQNPSKLSLTPWAPVNSFDDDDHYTIATAVGAIREHQYQSLDEHVLSQQYHKMYMIKPLAIKGKKNTMYQAYISLNKSEEDAKFPVPAEGTDYRLEIYGKENKPGKDWQGTVVQHTREELHRDGCNFDFVIYVERPKGGKMPRRVHANFKEMALNQDDGYSWVRLHASHADVVAERPLSALRKVRDGQGPLRDALIGRQRSEQTPRPMYEPEDANGVKFLDTCEVLADHWNLNEGQRDAVNNALHHTLSLIQGPPGTGKTRTIGALIWLSVIAGNRVLACAVSNKAVDGIATQLIEVMPRQYYPHLKRFPVVRLHLPTSERRHVTELGTRADMENLTRTDEGLEAAAQSSNLDDMAKVYRARSFKEEHWDMPEYSLAQAVVTLARIDARLYEDRYDPEDVCRDFRRILTLYDTDQFVTTHDQGLFHVQYKIMIHRVFDLCHVVIATCNNSASADLVSAYRPDVVIIDEASQAAEVETLIPIGNNLNAKRVVLVGDHKQLAPVVPSLDQNEFGTQRGLSLFERLLNLGYVSILLALQYRSTSNVMDFVSVNVYNGRLITSPDFRQRRSSELMRRLSDRMYGVKGHEAIFVDVPNGVQEIEGAGTSLHNTAEALVVVKILRSLLVNNLEQQLDPSLPQIKPRDVGVIVLYKAQRTKILVELQNDKEHGLDQVLVQDIESQTEISTVDSFQGSERDIILTSFVITSVPTLDNKAPSRFALDDRRLCVAMSRARYGLILIGNADALNNAKPRKGSDQTPAPKISLVATYHANRGSLGRDLTKDLSEEGQALLERRNAERQQRRAVAGTRPNPNRALQPARDVQEGADDLYQLKHRRGRTNVKRTAEGSHQDDRVPKRPQQDYALQQAVRQSLTSTNRGRGSFGGTSTNRGRGSFGGTSTGLQRVQGPFDGTNMSTGQQGLGVFGQNSAPGTMGLGGVLPAAPPGFMPAGPPGHSPGSVETPLPPAKDEELPPLPGAAGVAPPGTGTWDPQPAQTQQPAQQQGPRSGGGAPRNQRPGRGTNQGTAGRGSGQGQGRFPNSRLPKK